MKLQTPQKQLFLVGFILFLNLMIIHAQTIVNADFESWTGNCPYNVTPTGWTNISSSLGPDKAGNCTGSVSPFQGDAHMNLVWYSSTGLIEGASQTISGFNVGTTYDLQFHAINDQGLYSFGDPVFCEVYLNGNVIFTTPELFDGGAWTTYTTSFVASNDTLTIGFKVKNGLSGTSGSLGIDAVSFLNLTNEKESSQNRNLAIYPSPLFDELHIELNKPSEKFCKVTLFNTLGELIYFNVDYSNPKQIDFDFSQLSQGIYMVQVNVDGQIFNQSIIKM